MVPKIAQRGTSFKGALAYYLHDKRQEGEVDRQTNERVAWTETRGFYKDNLNPELAGRVMAATAMDQDRLKAEAGVRNTGQKSKGAVYAYSIAWHPDENGKIDRAEMLKAADQSLKAIGAQDRQAILVAHNDEAHPHVHVIVNLVSQEDGRNLSVHADRNKLSAWALSYRKERGEEKLYCPKRCERAETAARKRSGETVDFVAGEKSRSRSVEKDFKRAKAANENEALSVRDKQKAKDSALSVAGKSQAHRHKREWVDLDDRYKHKKRQIITNAKEIANDTEDQIKEQYSPLFRELYRNQYKENQIFNKRETKVFGKIENALYVVANRREIDPDNSRGLMGHAFNFLTSKKARANALEKLHKVEVRHLGKHQREEIGAAINAINVDKTALISRAGATYDTERTALIQRQAEEKKELQAKWKQRNLERRRAFDTIVKKAKVKERAPENHVQPEFKSAAEGTKRRSSRGRTRIRKRTSALLRLI